MELLIYNEWYSLKMNQFFRVIRYKEWYDSKWNIYFYVLLLYRIRHDEAGDLVCIRKMVVVMLFSFFLLAFGYAFNDYSDAKEDLNVGKTNHLALLKKSMQLLLVIALLFVGVAFPVCLMPALGMVLIVLLSFIMAVLYSYRRFGIKQRGLWGLVVSSLAQRVCPLLAVFYLFDDWSVTSFLLALLSFIVGLRWILVHQAEDHDNDKMSHTKSFVINLSNRDSKLLSIITIIFLCELSCLILILILNGNLSLSVIVPITYIIIQLIVMPFWFKIGWKRMVMSYDFAPLADFYYLWFGIYVAMALTISNPIYSVSFLFVMYFGYRYVILDYKYIRLAYDLKKGRLSAPNK